MQAFILALSAKIPDKHALAPAPAFRRSAAEAFLSRRQKYNV